MRSSHGGEPSAPEAAPAAHDAPGSGADARPDQALRWRDVRVRLGGRDVLDGVDLGVGQGSWLALVGPNGAGKTTLVRCLAGLLPHEGTIELAGKDAARLRASERARLVGFVPQHPVVPAGMRTLDYVLLGRTPHQGLRRSPSQRDQEVALAVLQRLDLEPFAGRTVDSLSGGERQRAVIARTLAQDTAVLVLDEPTTSLDVGHQLEVLELIEDLRAERGLTVVTTLHDLTLAGQFADRVALLARGRIVADGAPADVLTPRLIGEHYGVEVDVALDEGGVTVTVRRRRERTD
jgi:iron complex transport system ATP-binding protein